MKIEYRLTIQGKVVTETIIEDNQITVKGINRIKQGQIDGQAVENLKLGIDAVIGDMEATIAIFPAERFVTDPVIERLAIYHEGGSILIEVARPTNPSFLPLPGSLSSLFDLIKSLAKRALSAR